MDGTLKYKLGDILPNLYSTNEFIVWLEISLAANVKLAGVVVWDDVAM